MFKRPRTIDRIALALFTVITAACASPPARPDVEDASSDSPEASAFDALHDAQGDAIATCTMDRDCDDQVPCNGIERCMPAAPSADARGCVTTPPATPCDPHASERAACHFIAGAQPDDTLGDLAPVRAAITRVIVIVQENRSFDHMFGTLGHGTDGIPAGYTNQLGTGTVSPFHLTTPCVPDIGHQWLEMHRGWNNGAMNGWASINGRGALGYYEDADHPFYTWMLTTFATSDRYFGSVLSGTYPNRDYLYAGTSDGVHSTGGGYPHTPLLFDQLDTAHVAWAEYNASTVEVFSGTLGWPLNHPGVRLYSQFLPDLDAGTIPPVTFVDLEPHDEHPPGSIHDGERDVRDVISHAFTSPLWPHLAVFFTYDEGGGFFDHVPPPSACLAAPSETDFDRLGVRLPVAVVSPYSRAAFVSHDTHSHSSILRFVQAVFRLPALTGRDANSDALLDMFDFDARAFATPPSAVPAAGPPGC